MHPRCLGDRLHVGSFLALPDPLLSTRSAPLGLIASLRDKSLLTADRQLDDDGELQEDPAAGPRYSWQGMVVNGARGTKLAAAAPKRDAPRERSLTAPTAVASVFGAGADADLARHIENVAQSHHAEKRFAQR